MVAVTVQRTNKELDPFYKPLCNMQEFSVYKKDVSFVNGESYFSIFLFLKCLKSLSNLNLEDEISIVSCYFTSRTETVTIESEDDTIVETYYCFINTYDTGNFTFKVIPPHSMGNRIKNDQSFIEEQYLTMNLDLDFQFMGVEYDGVEEYPIKEVQLPVLMALHTHRPRIERSDFLFICREFYGMTKGLNSFENVRIKRIINPNECDLSDHNPAMLYLECDNIDRVVHNNDTDHKFIIGYSTNYREAYFKKNLKTMKLL